MSSTTDPRIDQALVDAIAALGNRTRLEILLALAEAEREHRTQGYRLSFTELYNAIDVESTSQFSYHLTQLVGQFVAETPDGYRLTYSGDRIVRTVLSGLYEHSRSFDAIDVDGVCVFCEKSTLAAAVDEEHFVVRCRSCESTLLTDLLPRSQTRGRSAAAVVDSVGTRIWGSRVLVAGGVCPVCYGRADAAVDAHRSGDRHLYTVDHTCRECRLAVHIPLEATAAFHPAAIGFFWDHGISLQDRPLWEFFEFIVTGAVTADVAAVDPLEATVEISLDGETLRLAVDDDLRVTTVPADDR
ncbi:ArsR/SmtB family transcription factor [Natrononativus amylolyticus]|uniref:ArsR/SmtB family transcription factor n=1 Tax=Natrononativus amylolyticus TaxID=2963434 RepID=UPI0020CBDE15|nr:ArsR family transcriptional regulator [Natrononativus amylolyticus]